MCRFDAASRCHQQPGGHDRTAAANSPLPTPLAFVLLLLLGFAVQISHSSLPPLFPLPWSSSLSPGPLPSPFSPLPSPLAPLMCATMVTEWHLVCETDSVQVLAIKCVAYIICTRTYFVRSS